MESMGLLSAQKLLVRLPLNNLFLKCLKIMVALKEETKRRIRKKIGRSILTKKVESEE